MARMYPNERERWTCCAVDSVDGAVAQLQPLTVEQERHRVGKAPRRTGGRGAHRGSKRKGGLLEQRLGMPGKVVDDAGGRVKVDKVGEAESGPVKRLSQSAHHYREAGLKELSAQPLRHVRPCWRLESEA